jgi:hypothetical protein
VAPAAVPVELLAKLMSCPWQIVMVPLTAAGKLLMEAVGVWA